ncbi:hypothetical protein [Collimonas arenae]|nr:hypothetical protein [Collimonas arenae]
MHTISFSLGITMRLFFAVMATLLIAACGHAPSNGDAISGSSITPYGVIDTGVTRTTGR